MVDLAKTVFSLEHQHLQEFGGSRIGSISSPEGISVYALPALHRAFGTSVFEGS